MKQLNNFISSNEFALVTLFAALIAALIIIVKSRGNVWYGGAILWGLAAVFFANFRRAENILIVYATVVLFLVVVLAFLYSRRNLA